MNTTKASVLGLLTTGVQIQARESSLTLILMIIVNVVTGIMFGLDLFIMHLFFDSVHGLIYTSATQRVYLMALLMCVMMIAGNILSGLRHTLYNYTNNKLRGRMTIRLHEKVAKIDPLYFEETKHQNDLSNAFSGAGNIVFMLLRSMEVFIFIPHIIFMAVYFSNLQSHFLVVIVVTFLPVMFTQYIRTKISADIAQRATPLRREQEYYQQAITSKEYFKETRVIGGAFTFFYSSFLDAINRLLAVEKVGHKKMLK